MQFLHDSPQTELTGQSSRLVMWHQAPEPVLKIAPASVRGLPLHNKQRRRCRSSAAGPPLANEVCQRVNREPRRKVPISEWNSQADMKPPLWWDKSAFHKRNTHFIIRHLASPPLEAAERPQWNGFTSESEQQTWPTRWLRR